MSYVSEHNCPTTLLLIHLRNARDLAQAACPSKDHTLLDELPAAASRRVAAEIAKSILALNKAIAVVQEHRGGDPVPLIRIANKVGPAKRGHARRPGDNA